MKKLMVIGLLIFMCAPAQAQLRPEEQHDLQYAREVEKMARDVYEVLYANWNEYTFFSLMEVESWHMQVLKDALDKFGVADPLAGIDSDNGAFTIAVLEQRYCDWTSEGMQSVAAAYRVAARAEEYDIRDLQTCLAATENAELRQIYQQLILSSENHLRACVDNLERLGEQYVPEVLTEEEVSRILQKDRQASAKSGA